MTRTPPTPEQLAALAEKDLYYEVAMLLGVLRQYKICRGDVPDFYALDRAHPYRVECSALFESALLHCRVLDEFLTEKPRESGPYADSVWAGDYFAEWRPREPGPLVRAVSVSEGQNVKTTLNKQLTHFSVKRLDQAKFVIDHIIDEVAKDMRDFASAAVGQHPALSGICGLLDC